MSINANELLSLRAKGEATEDEMSEEAYPERFVVSDRREY